MIHTASSGPPDLAPQVVAVCPRTLNLLAVADEIMPDPADGKAARYVVCLAGKSRSYRRTVIQAPVRLGIAKVRSVEEIEKSPTALAG